MSKHLVAWLVCLACTADCSNVVHPGPSSCEDIADPKINDCKDMAAKGWCYGKHGEWMMLFCRNSFFGS